MTKISIICMLFILSFIAGVAEVWIFVLFGVFAFFIVGFVGGMFQGVFELFGYNTEPKNEQYKKLEEIDRKYKEAKRRGDWKEAGLISWNSLDTQGKQYYWELVRKTRKKYDLPLDEDTNIDTPPEEYFYMIR